MKSFITGVLIVAVGALPALAGGRVNHCYPHRSGHYYGQAVHHYHHGYMVGQPLRDDAAAEKLADKLLPVYQQKLDEMMGQFKADLAGKITLEFGASGSTGVTTGGGKASPTGVTGGNLAAMQAIFDARCVKCHQGTAAKGGLDLTDAAGLPKDVLYKSAIKAVRGTMPPAPASPIPSDESDVLLEIAEAL